MLIFSLALGTTVSASDGSSSEEVTFEPVWILIALGIGIVIAFIVVLIMKSQLKSVHFQAAANNYIKENSLNVTLSRDIFLYSTVTRVAKPTDKK